MEKSIDKSVKQNSRAKSKAMHIKKQSGINVIFQIHGKRTIVHELE